MSSAALLAESATDLGGFAGWAVDLMERLGGVGAGIAIGLENLFPPLPSEVILPLAGFTASQGDLSIASALIWTTIGSVVGAVVLYYLGVALGRDRLRAIVDRLPLVKLSDVDKAEAWFAKHGTKAVFFGRMIPIFRSLISIPAGIEKMPVWKFLGLTAAGSAIWNSIFVVAGFVLGENWHVVDEYAGVLQWIVIVVVAALLLWWLIVRIRTISARRSGTDSAAQKDAAREQNDEHPEVIDADK